MSYNPQHGAADSYYQEGQQDIGMKQTNGYPPQGQYQQQQQQQSYPEQPQQYPPQNQYQQPYPQQPPQYGQPNNGPVGEKHGFEQKFKVDRPKYNDIWAAALFLLTFAGFIAVSGLSIYGYSSSKGQQGGGIYNNPEQTNTVSLNTNTIVLL